MFASVQAGLMVDVAPSPAVSDIAPAVSVAAFSDLPHAPTASTAAVSSITLKPGVFDNIESPNLETALAGAVVDWLGEMARNVPTEPACLQSPSRGRRTDSRRVEDVVLAELVEAALHIEGERAKPIRRIRRDLNG